MCLTSSAVGKLPDDTSYWTFYNSSIYCIYPTKGLNSPQITTPPGMLAGGLVNGKVVMWQHKPGNYKEESWALLPTINLSDSFIQVSSWSSWWVVKTTFVWFGFYHDSFYDAAISSSHSRQVYLSLQQTLSRWV